MKVKNISGKVVGFGNTHILPGEVGELPQGYSESHPVVKFYLEKKFLASVNYIPEETEADIAARAAAASAALEAEAKAKAEALEAEAKEALEQKVKSLEALKLEELQILAGELGVEFAPTDTKAILKQKITDAYQSE
jgi:hypothetical protein